MKFDFNTIFTHAGFLLQATVITIELTVLGIIVGLILGLISALMKISPFRPLKAISDFYVWIIRGTPLLLQLFLIYFGLPQVGLELSAFVSSIIGIGLNSGAYISEIFRSGIESIPIGQVEAARSLGMTRSLAMRRIILPQALKVSLPPLGNMFIIGLKDTSLCSAITMAELMQTAQRFASVDYSFIEYYTATAAIYLFLTTIISLGIRYLEKRLKISITKRGVIA